MIRANRMQKNERIASKKGANRSTNSHFSYVFESISPLLMPMSESLPLLFAHVLFFQERPERFAHDKRAA